MNDNHNTKAGFASLLNACANRRVEEAELSGNRIYLTASVALAGLADQFEAGDFDVDLMRQYEALIWDADLRDDIIDAGAAAVLRIGMEPGFNHPDDLLSTVIREAQRA